MTIRIIADGPDITLTESEYARLQLEYEKAFMYYSGVPPTFEEWVRGQKKFVVENAKAGKQLLNEG